jgi:esterase/lipase
MMSIDNVLIFLGGVLATLLPLLFSKRKQVAETATTEVQSAREVIAEWKSLSDEFKSTIARMDATNKQLVDQNTQLLMDNNKLLEDNVKQQQLHKKVLDELHSLKLAYSKLEKMYQTLKQELKK